MTFAIIKCRIETEEMEYGFTYLFLLLEFFSPKRKRWGVTEKGLIMNPKIGD